MRKKWEIPLCAAVLLGVSALGISVPAAETETEELIEDTEEDLEEDSGEDTEEGEILNIYAWDEEFMNRMEDHIWGYKKQDDTTATIGDLTVKWHITSTKDNAYQQELDAGLLAQKNAEADEKIDLFLVEAEYAQKYADTDYTLSMEELGISEEDLAGQFAYTREIISDSDGNQKGAAWQSYPGVLIYRRDIAKEVLGTDDPDKVQKYLSDWEKFAETAAKMQEAGYLMTASAEDTYPVYSCNTTSRWIEESTVRIDEHLLEWAQLSEQMVQAGQTGTSKAGSKDWNAGLYADGKVFCYFGPSWFYEYSMDGTEEDSVGIDGGWAVTAGPESFFQGGTWICAAAGTDNLETVKEILYTLTCDTETMSAMAKGDGEFVNNLEVMEALTEEESLNREVLGGQNPTEILLANAQAVNLHDSYAKTGYDEACGQEFQSAMTAYFKGKESLEEAEDSFYKTLTGQYPELTAGQQEQQIKETDIRKQ